MLRALFVIEALYLTVNGWKRSTIGGPEPVWISPPGVRVVNTELGAVTCMQCEAVYRQRMVALGLGAAMSRSPTYATLDDWVIGRIARHPSLQRSMPAHMLESPPEYLFKDEWDARDALRELRDQQLIAAHSKRFYLTTKGRQRWNELRKTLKA